MRFTRAAPVTWALFSNIVANAGNEPGATLRCLQRKHNICFLYCVVNESKEDDFDEPAKIIIQHKTIKSKDVRFCLSPTQYGGEADGAGVGRCQTKRLKILWWTPLFDRNLFQNIGFPCHNKNWYKCPRWNLSQRKIKIFVYIDTNRNLNFSLYLYLNLYFYFDL